MERHDWVSCPMAEVDLTTTADWTAVFPERVQVARLVFTMAL